MDAKLNPETFESAFTGIMDQMSERGWDANKRALVYDLSKKVFEDVTTATRRCVDLADDSFDVVLMICSSALTATLVPFTIITGFDKTKTHELIDKNIDAATQIRSQIIASEKNQRA
jgi:hypothetical protein